MLLKTFAKSVKARPEWVLLIAESDEGGHIHEVRALIQEVRMEESVSSNGPVFGREKAYAFTAASMLVLASHTAKACRSECWTQGNTASLFGY